MSRHRFVRNININEELEDYALSDGGEEEMSVDQQEQLDVAYAEARSILGSEESSGISDEHIRDAVWEYYFDVEQSVKWLLEERTKSNAIKDRKAAKEREFPIDLPSHRDPISKATQPPKLASSSSTSSRAVSPTLGLLAKSKTKSLTGRRPIHDAETQLDDFITLDLQDREDVEVVDKEIPVAMSTRENLLIEARKALEQEATGKKSLSLVVIGHVDAGKSTLMGRLLYELGRVDEKTRSINERTSQKAGKSSFSWAWQLDSTAEERERGVTMDIALQIFSTPHRHITVLDAPGHRDFIPNMISGASQADSALLVVDSSPGEFEAGFTRGGQTKEHLLLVRSLGVTQIVIAVNKLDQVDWQKARYDEIINEIRPFLIQSGFPLAKAKFVPVGAITGINLVKSPEIQPVGLGSWYHGPALVDLLDQLDPPTRSLEAPLRIPISDVFRGHAALSSGLGVSGRVCSGVVQVGDRLRALPGDESAVVRLIDRESESVQWAAAGSNITLYLSAIDQIHLGIGMVLCTPTDIVPLVTRFAAQIVIFDVEPPITAGTSVELFHHSRSITATVSKLLATLDRATAAVIKQNPRLLMRMSSAKVEVSLRSTTASGPSAKVQSIPLETFKSNKEMGRVLLRRNGETIAAGIVLELL